MKKHIINAAIGESRSSAENLANYAFKYPRTRNIREKLIKAGQIDLNRIVPKMGKIKKFLFQHLIK